MKPIVLTESQIDNLIEFFDLYFIRSIRDDEELDNLHYLIDMCDIYKRLLEATVKEDGQ